MKKTRTIAWILCLTLSLTGCSQLLSDALKEKETDKPTGPVYTQGDGSQPTGAEEPTEEPTEVPSDAPTEPAKPEMLGYDEYGFSVWPEGNYLADPKFDTDEFLPDFDVDNNLHMYNLDVSCSTADTAYLIKRTALYQCSLFLMFTDKDTGITLPLCGRPECTHDNDNCDAYLGQNDDYLQIYDGKLYWASMNSLNFGYELNRMNPDSSDREMVMKLDKSFRSYSGFLHRGYLYCFQGSNTVSSGKVQSKFEFLARPLDGGEAFTILSQTRENVSITGAYASPLGNDFYITLCGFKIHGDYFVQIFHWSAKTRKAELLFEADPWEMSMARRPYPKAGDGLYFMSDDTLMRFRFDSRTFEEVCTIHPEDAWAGGLTEEHIIVCEHDYTPENCIQLYDYEGNLVFESQPLRERMMLIWVTGEDETYIYLSYIGGTNEENTIGYMAIPKDGSEIIEIKGELP